MKKSTAFTLLAVVVVGAGLYALLAVPRSSSPSATGTQIGTRVGNTAPAFSITTTDGTTLSSDALRGKVVVLTSAAQWCATCQEEAKEFAPAYQTYKGKSVAFITIDIDPRDSIASIEQFKKTYQTPWAYADAQGAAALISAYGMNSFEMTYIIDASGVVRFNGDVLTRPDILTAQIQKAL